MTVREAPESRVSPGLLDAVSKAVSRSQDYFARTQSPEGYWWGELESNSTMEAEYLMLTHFLGIGDGGYVAEAGEPSARNPAR